MRAGPGQDDAALRRGERDYANLYHRFSLARAGRKEDGVETAGIHWAVSDLYDECVGPAPRYEWNGHALSLARAGRGRRQRPAPLRAGDQRRVGLPRLRGGGEQGGPAARRPRRGAPRRPLSTSRRSSASRGAPDSPCWTGIIDDGRAYSAYCLNVERLVPWRTLTGRQHLYLDHPGYLAFGEACRPSSPLDSSAHAQPCRRAEAGRARPRRSTTSPRTASGTSTPPTATTCACSRSRAGSSPSG